MSEEEAYYLVATLEWRNRCIGVGSSGRWTWEAVFVCRSPLPRQRPPTLNSRRSPAVSLRLPTSSHSLPDGIAQCVSSPSMTETVLMATIATISLFSMDVILAGVCSREEHTRRRT
jgi:hypothetical protein